MTPVELQKLVDAVKNILPAVIKEWNEIKLIQFETLYEQSFEQYFKNLQTQEKTKRLSSILDSIFARHIQAIIPEFRINEGNGRDYTYGVIDIESKITFGAGPGWTGNGYQKTPWHLLLKFNQDRNGIITGQFAMIVDLSKCASKWTLPGKSGNFSGLTFLADDEDKINIIVGKMSNKTKKGRDNATYLTPIME